MEEGSPPSWVAADEAEAAAEAAEEDPEVAPSDDAPPATASTTEATASFSAASSAGLPCTAGGAIPYSAAALANAASTWAPHPTSDLQERFVMQEGNTIEEEVREETIPEQQAQARQGIRSQVPVQRPPALSGWWRRAWAAALLWSPASPGGRAS